jgi:hypothetical protein
MNCCHEVHCNHDHHVFTATQALVFILLLSLSHSSQSSDTFTPFVLSFCLFSIKETLSTAAKKSQDLVSAPEAKWGAKTPGRMFERRFNRF